MDLISAFKDLRASGARPRVHPNGFIQVDRSPNQRFHVWPSTPLPRPEVLLSELHDHVYGFHSQILCGTLHNIEYEILEDKNGPLRMMHVAPYLVHGKTLPMEQIDPKRYSSRIINVAIMPARTEYRFEARRFHRTLAEGVTVSIMTTDPYDPAQKARVMCRADAPDPVFLRESVEPNELWRILENL